MGSWLRRPTKVPVNVYTTPLELDGRVFRLGPSRDVRTKSGVWHSCTVKPSNKKPYKKRTNVKNKTTKETNSTEGSYHDLTTSRKDSGSSDPTQDVSFVYTIYSKGVRTQCRDNRYSSYNYLVLIDYSPKGVFVCILFQHMTTHSFCWLLDAGSFQSPLLVS